MSDGEGAVAGHVKDVSDGEGAVAGHVKYVTELFISYTHSEHEQSEA